MFELLAKLNINFSSKDQVLELMDKCNTLLVGGKAAFLFDICPPPLQNNNNNIPFPHGMALFTLIHIYYSNLSANLHPMIELSLPHRNEARLWTIMKYSNILVIAGYATMGGKSISVKFHVSKPRTCLNIENN